MAGFLQDIQPGGKTVILTSAVYSSNQEKHVGNSDVVWGGYLQGLDVISGGGKNKTSDDNRSPGKKTSTKNRKS